MKPLHCAILASLLATFFASACLAQSLPKTAGETLSGKPIVLANAVRGHSAVLIAGFSREGGAGSGDWVRTIQSDPALSGVAVYQVAEIAGAPSLIRGMIRNGMRKGLTPAQQDAFVVLTEDETQWKAFFSVTADNVPYVTFLDANGKVLWLGHGPASTLEPQLRGARR